MVDEESDYEAEVKAKVQDFSWKVTALNTTSLEIEVTLNNPAVYGLDDYPQYFTVAAYFSDFEPGWNDTDILATAEIP